jgi:ATP-binding protein involved in chromosome partitioning
MSTDIRNSSVGLTDTEILQIVKKWEIPKPIATMCGAVAFRFRILQCTWDADLGLRIFFQGHDISLENKKIIETFIQNQAIHTLKSDLPTLTVDRFSVYFRGKTENSNPDQTNISGSTTSGAGASGAPPITKGIKPIPGIKHIIAVSSAKGGVGKSTISTMLALELKKWNYKVGLLDTDIYGPSLPTLFGLENKIPDVTTDKKILPIYKWGIPVMSFGFFATEDQPVIWRGPMIMKALQNFFWDVAWGELDFLILDLPPGTGDVPITIVQNLPLQGSIMVTTPESLSQSDVSRGFQMFKNLGIPVWGVVENMSYFTCDSCSKKHFIFQEKGGQAIADKYNIPLLAEFPLFENIQSQMNRWRAEHTDANTKDLPIFMNTPSIQDALQSLVKKVLEQTGL